MSDQELKPCPFCGKVPAHEELVNNGHDNPEWWIECQDDDCTVNPWIGDSCRETAKERWNTRTPDPMLEALADVLGDLLYECDGMFDTCKPTRHTYNLGFAALEKYQQSKAQS